jgi:hypothetical protein
MKTTYLFLLAAVTATTSLAASAVPFTTDEARSEARQRLAAVEHTAALRPFEPLDADLVRITDTDSARSAAAQANARQAHAAHLAEVLGAGTGFEPAPILVTDTDSARAAAGQMGHRQALLADYADYVKTQVQAAFQPTDASNR